jgi:S1-C subfamily serine protease
VVKKVAPSVVNIFTTKTVKNPNGPDMSPFSSDRSSGGSSEIRMTRATVVRGSGRTKSGAWVPESSSAKTATS